MPPTANDIAANEELYNLLIELKKPGKDGYPLITEVYDEGRDITSVTSNITGEKLQSLAPSLSKHQKLR